MAVDNAVADAESRRGDPAQMMMTPGDNDVDFDLVLLIICSEVFNFPRLGTDSLQSLNQSFFFETLFRFLGRSGDPKDFGLL